MNVNDLVCQVTALMKPHDDKALESKLEEGKQIRVAVAAYKADPEAKLLARNDPWKYYGKLWTICGSKGMYRKINDNSLDGLLAALTKEHHRLVAARCDKIAYKLNSIGVTEILDGGFVKSPDGFQGLYKILTAQGDKKIRIQVIVAGGYNIQCRHCRVLVNIVD